MNNQKDLSLAYSPGVAVPCIEIGKNPDAEIDYIISIGGDGLMLKTLHLFQNKDSEGKDDGMNLLFSIDHTKSCDSACQGLIYPSTNREWIEKSDTGLPFVKYVLQLINKFY